MCDLYSDPIPWALSIQDTGTYYFWITNFFIDAISWLLGHNRKIFNSDTHVVHNAPGHLSRASVLLCAAEFWKQSCRILLFASFWIFPFLNFSLISVIRWLFSSLDFDEIIWINPFQANAPILYLLQTPENLWFSGVFTGYKMWTLAWNGLIPNFAHFHQHHKLWIF